MRFEDIAAYLQEHMGLNPDSIGFGTIRKAVYNCMLVNELSSFEEYYERITGDSKLLQELVDAVVIPETSFFRDKQPFDSLKDNLVYYRSEISKENPLQVLSIPSSTGEEPYSIAMALVESGLEFGEFEIHAYDISKRLLAIAEKGVYSEYSFRGSDRSYKDKYFTEKDNMYHLSEEIKGSVVFHHGNIIGENFLRDNDKKYHVIFCRNLLIYFDRSTKVRAITSLATLMFDNSILVVGHADTALLPVLGFRSISKKFSFTYSKSSFLGAKTVSSENGKRVAQASSLKNQSWAEKRPLSLSTPSVGKVDVSKDTNISPITMSGESDKTKFDEEKVKELIDKKELDQARQLCESSLGEGLVDAPVFHYLGLIEYESGDNDKAEEFLKKSIYLDPDNFMALIYLSTLAEKSGDFDASSRYKTRADRIQRRKTDSKE